MGNNIVLRSQVSLVRNYADLPFDLRENPNQAEACITRVFSALQGREGFACRRVLDLSEAEISCLMEEGFLISDARHAHGALCISKSLNAAVVVNGENQLWITAIRPGLDLRRAYETACQVEEILAGRGAFAFDGQMGYLASRLNQTGLGMQAAMVVAVPAQYQEKKMIDFAMAIVDARVNMRSVFGAGGDAPGGLFRLYNRDNLGVTEEEILHCLEVLAQDGHEKECQMHKEIAQTKAAAMRDVVWGAYSVLTNAFILPMEKFISHWANVRIGALMGIINIPVEKLDQLLLQAQPGHVCRWRGQDITGDDLARARAALVQQLING